MNNQGYSLGKQLCIFVPAITDLCDSADKTGSKVWFLGRDCDVFFEAYKSEFGNVRYITGLNRENAKKLQHRRQLSKWLKSIGVKSGDILVDSGYSGSIYERIERDNPEFFQNIRCILLSANPEGFTGEPLFYDSICDSSSKLRHAILALEHSPKREVCSWNEEKRKPKVVKADDLMLVQAVRFFDGCSSAIKEAIMK
jgi:hypothetical protein